MKAQWEKKIDMWHDRRLLKTSLTQKKARTLMQDTLLVKKSFCKRRARC